MVLSVGARAQAETRVALVVGNSSYGHIETLDNPGNDARDLTVALEARGFDVITGLDLDRQGIADAVEAFSDRAESADVALFYYAGHAVQVADVNYFIPVDFDPARGDILTQMFAMPVVTDGLSDTQGLRMIMLDACRSPVKGLTEAEPGLARMGNQADLLIVYATQPGAVAFDGDGRNAPFTEALLTHMHEQGQPIADMMIEVRRDVIAATGGQQIPWESSSLTRSFEFNPGARAAPAETMLYQLAERTGSRDLADFYLDRYPDGPHRNDIQTLALLDDGTDAPMTPSATRSLGSDPEAGDELWQLALQTRTRRLAEIYLSLYPDGPHVGSARDLLRALPGSEELGPGRLCERLATHPRDETPTTPGVTLGALARNATVAMDACREAASSFPEQPKFVALLARATYAAAGASPGLIDEAIALYRDAAARGDLRALVSLGNLAWEGINVPQDKAYAIALYERAAAGNSIDGLNNLAVEYANGTVIEKDMPRALDLFRRAAELGSSQSHYNLGQLISGDPSGDLREAYDHYMKAAELGLPAGYRRAALLKDGSAIGTPDPSQTSILLLRYAAEDNGSFIDELSASPKAWSPPTIRSLQSRLSRADLYAGGIDGVVGPQLIAALEQWRKGGFDAQVLTD